MWPLLLSTDMHLCHACASCMMISPSIGFARPVLGVIDGTCSQCASFTHAGHGVASCVQHGAAGGRVRPGRVLCCTAAMTLHSCDHDMGIMTSPNVALHRPGARLCVSQCPSPHLPHASVRLQRTCDRCHGLRIAMHGSSRTAQGAVHGALSSAVIHRRSQQERAAGFNCPSPPALPDP